MYEVDNRYLKFVDSFQMNSWDVKYFFKNNNTFNKNHKLVFFGEFLKKATIEKVNISDKEKYKILGVRSYGKGAFINREVYGSSLKMRQYFKAKKDHLFWCKVDTKNGAFGIIDDELAEGYASSNMIFTQIDLNKIIPEFLQLLFRDKKVIQYLDSFVTGTTNRKYIRPDQLLNEIQIPLPSIAEQKAILDDYQQKIENAKQQETKAQILEQSIEKYLFEELGIVENKSVSKKGFGLRFFDFSNIDRWDVWTKKNLYESSKYKYQNFEKIIIGKPLYGANVKGVHKHSDTRYIRITDINESGDLNNDFVSPEFVEEKYLLQENDFLIARSGNTVGKTFLYKNHFGRAIYAGYLIKFNINSEIAFPKYVFEFTKSKIFKDWINSNQRISGQPNINGQEYLSAPFLIPPLEKQKEIAEHISAIKDKIKSLKQNAETLKAEAEREFEEKIFN